jgi:hypothetical protein
MPNEHDRFWSKVAVAGPDECWEWQRMRQRQGYGMYSVSGKMKYAHRVAWEFMHGPISDGLHVLHKCDNPPCCNPNHLFLGTHTDNMRDMFAKGRCHSARGERNVNSKLTEVIVKEMRRLYATGAHTQTDLAAMYGVHVSLVHLVVRGKIWKHLLDD